MEVDIFEVHEEFHRLINVCKELISLDDIDDLDDYILLRILLEGSISLQDNVLFVSDLMLLPYKYNMSSNLELKKEIINMANERYNYLIENLDLYINLCATHKCNDYRCIDFIRQFGNICTIYKTKYITLHSMLIEKGFYNV